MLYLVHVVFLPGCAISPEEFFRRVNARWVWSENGFEGTGVPQSGDSGSRDLLCIADLESAEQFAIDVSIMPGSISLVELEALPNLVPDFSRQ